MIDYTPPDTDEGVKITGALFDADGGRDIAEAVALSGEPNLNGVLSPDAKELSTFEYWRLCYKRKQFITRQLAAWEATEKRTGTGRPIDALISPTAPYTSFTHDSQQFINYTGLFNVTDQSVGIVPVTRVTKEDVKGEPHEFATDFDRINFERCEFGNPVSWFDDMHSFMQLVESRRSQGVHRRACVAPGGRTQGGRGSRFAADRDLRCCAQSLIDPPELVHSHLCSALRFCRCSKVGNRFVERPEQKQRESFFMSRQAFALSLGIVDRARGSVLVVEHGRSPTRRAKIRRRGSVADLLRHARSPCSPIDHKQTPIKNRIARRTRTRPTLDFEKCRANRHLLRRTSCQGSILPRSKSRS